MRVECTYASNDNLAEEGFDVIVYIVFNSRNEAVYSSLSLEEANAYEQAVTGRPGEIRRQTWHVWPIVPSGKGLPEGLWEGEHDYDSPFVFYSRIEAESFIAETQREFSEVAYCRTERVA